ncbi:hypothetical protein [Streptomyces phaeofaciens]|nr:hypothetical protein [Streptomyces phaeofaciens]
MDGDRDIDLLVSGDGDDRLSGWNRWETAASRPTSWLVRAATEAGRAGGREVCAAARTT